MRRILILLLVLASPAEAATTRPMCSTPADHCRSATRLGSVYYYCRAAGSGRFWFRCGIIDGREICTNTRITCVRG